MQPLVFSFCVILFSLFQNPGFDANAADFKVRLTAQPQSLDWNSATSGSEGALIQNLMEGLFGFDAQWNLVPVLATGHRLSADNKTLEIDLKKNVKWRDGTRLKSAHFIDSFQRLLNPTLNSPNASLLFDVVGARDYFFGKLKNFSEVGITAPRDDLIRITLKEPRANILSVFTHWATYPYRKDKPTQTLGAYQLAARKNDEIQLKVNPSYHRQAPEIKTVSFKVVANGESALKDFEAKKIDYLLQLEDSVFEQNKDIKGLGFVDPIRVVALLHLNPSRVLTNSPEKRRKIMSAINLAELIRMNAQTRVAAPSIIPRGLPGGPPQSYKEGFKPAASNASFPDSSLILGYPKDELSKSIAERIQATSKNLKIKIEPLGPNDLTAAKRYDLILTLFGLDYFDPDQLFSSFLSQGTHDLFNLNSAELLSLIQKARSTQNIKDRAQIYSEAADYLQNRTAVVMPLFYRRRAFLLNPHYQAEAGSTGSPLISRIHRIH